MVFTMALASFLIHVKKVPAKDSLGFLWGSPFLISNSDLVFLIFTVSILFIYLISNFKKIKIILFDKDIGISMGINYNLNYNFMVLLISLIVAVGLKILGAFLIDCLLLLPVLIALEISKSFKAKGIKKVFVLSSFIGFISSFFGFLLSVIFDLPLGATISALTIIFLIIIKIKNLMGVILK
jgi:zinc transport system permease protein